jgi:hypothetical protein
LWPGCAGSSWHVFFGHTLSRRASRPGFADLRHSFPHWGGSGCEIYPSPTLTLPR